MNSRARLHCACGHSKWRLLLHVRLQVEIETEEEWNSFLAQKGLGGKLTFLVIDLVIITVSYIQLLMSILLGVGHVKQYCHSYVGSKMN